MTRTKIAVMIPAYLSVPIPSWASIINFLSGVPEEYEMHIFHSSSPYIHENRNMLAKLFEMQDKSIQFDYVFFLDSDIVFGMKDFLALKAKMDEKNASIGSGVYFNLVGDQPVPIITRLKEEDDSYTYLTTKELVADNNGVMEYKDQTASGAGLGFVLCKAQVLRDLFEKNQSTEIFKFRRSKNGLIGEDNVFFEDARKLGHLLWVFPEIKVGHAKVIVL